MLALEEPVRVTVRPPEPLPAPEPFYSPGRIRHALSHWACCLGCVSDRKMPGVCSNDPYVSDRARAPRPDAKTNDASVMFEDIYGAWARLRGLQSKVLISFVEMGPRERMDLDYEWYDKRLDWWITNRMRFANLPAEYLLRLADSATETMSYDLTHLRHRAN